jgi:methanol metabolism-related c-type cytochrome
MFLRNAVLGVTLTLLPLSATGIAAAQDTKEKAAPVKQEDGKWYDADGNPTFHIDDDGSVDWYTFSGYRRYHSDCHVCHGPDGVGSSYAPALAESLKTMDYGTFLSIVAEGRKNVGGGKENVMPAFGDNKNVYCYLDDLYVYLRARAVDAIPRGRPPKKDDKPQAAKDHEKECMGG